MSIAPYKFPTEEGYYLLDVDGERCVAEAMLFSTGEVNWLPTGADCDVWQYSTYWHTIKVLARVNLETLACELFE